MTLDEPAFAPLATERLMLRPFTADDGPAILAYMSDPAVTRWLPEGLMSPARCRTFARRQAIKPTALAVIEQAGGALVGQMPFHPWFAGHTWEVGWALARDRQGLGYATEAARALLARAFGPLQAHRVIATCQPQNRASWRVAEKIGMRREGHFRAGIPRPDGTWWDEYFYAILAEEYAGKTAAPP